MRENIHNLSLVKPVGCLPFSEESKDAWDLLVKSEYPNIKNEKWKYTPVRKLKESQYTQEWHSRNDFQKYLDPSRKNIVFAGECIVHIDDGLLMRALQKEDLALFSQLNDSSVQDLFTLMSDSALESAQVFTGSGDIHMVHLGGEKGNISNAQFVFNVSSEANIKEVFVGSSFDALSVMRWNVHVNAPLTWQVHQERSCAKSLFTQRFRVSKGGSVDHFLCHEGGALVKNEFNFDLEYEGLSIKTNAVCFLKENDHLENHSSINHNTPGCKSDQEYRYVIDGEARGVFNGRVNVKKGAQLTNAVQLNKSLLLSDGSEMDTLPQLMIDTDDVKCSHGATISQLSKEELFYLNARGISGSDAKKMLASAFMMSLLPENFKNCVDRYFVEGES